MFNSSDIKEMQIKITRKFYYFIFTRMVKSKKITVLSVDKYRSKRNSHIADGNVNWYKHFGKLFDKISVKADIHIPTAKQFHIYMDQHIYKKDIY